MGLVAMPEDDKDISPPAKKARTDPGTPASPSWVTLLAAHSEDAGARVAMEDVSVIDLGTSDPDSDGGTEPSGVRCAFAAVFDGHGGVDVARLAADTLHDNVLKAGLAEVLTQAGTQAEGRVEVKTAKAAISQGFSTTDQAVLEQCSAHNWLSGACTVAAWVLGNTVLVANVGDAKAVLARVTDKDVGAVKAGSLRGVQLSKDHIALTERQRIQKAGGWISSDGRLMGKMQVSRSFGDAALKKVGCICTPDITAFAITPRDHFMLLACDGFWTVFDAQSAVTTTSQLLAEGLECKAVTNRLINMAIRQRKCTDNCSVLLLQFKQPTAAGQ